MTSTSLIEDKKHAQKQLCCAFPSTSLPHTKATPLPTFTTTPVNFPSIQKQHSPAIKYLFQYCTYNTTNTTYNMTNNNTTTNTRSNNSRSTISDSSNASSTTGNSQSNRRCNNIQQQPTNETVADGIGYNIPKPIIIRSRTGEERPLTFVEMDHEVKGILTLLLCCCCLWCAPNT